MSMFRKVELANVRIEKSCTLGDSLAAGLIRLTFPPWEQDLTLSRKSLGLLPGVSGAKGTAPDPVKVKLRLLGNSSNVSLGFLTSIAGSSVTVRW